MQSQLSSFSSVDFAWEYRSKKNYIVKTDVKDYTARFFWEFYAFSSNIYIFNLICVYFYGSGLVEGRWLQTRNYFTGRKEDRQQLLNHWSFSVLPEEIILKKEKEIPLALPNQC